MLLPNSFSKHSSPLPLIACSKVDVNKILVSESLPCIQCDLWARKSCLINKASAKKWAGSTMHPFAALSLLLVDQETCLLESRGWKDSTMIKLFDAVKATCDASIKVFENILGTSEGLAYSSEIDQQAQQVIEKMKSVKRRFEEEEED